MARKKRPFDQYIQKTENCWLWKGRITSRGYGQYNIGYIAGRTIWRSAHRYAWEQANGRELNDRYVFVCHHCDVPNCVRPDHLFIGSNSDNILDALAKGKLKSLYKGGEQHPRAKLKTIEVEEIRKLLKEGISQNKIASKFKVAQPTISKINIGLRWKS